ncbi:hypothetical protein PQ478_19705 [Alkalihalophilus pseudofirmus]|uniref:hypothetical protein n=1 Tax=Alkalihalophilus pseudofirmus TaxID=79885 RepID=UPI00259B4E9C|nr:hypothetical protein [Alkalihalophilus pseudofirmus]WEG16705.1 hypothetical protein PQ478_19705 [Alkalihalophilus pseudofirmus]
MNQKNVLSRVFIFTLAFLLVFSTLAPPNIILANSNEYDVYDEISNEEMLLAYWGEEADIKVISEKNGGFIYTLVENGVTYEYHEYNEGAANEMKTRSVIYKYKDDEKILIDDYIEELLVTDESIIIETEDMNGQIEHFEVELSNNLTEEKGLEDNFTVGIMSSSIIERGGSSLSNVRYERFSDGRARAWFQTGTNAKWTRSSNNNFKDFRDHARDLGSQDKDLLSAGLTKVVTDILNIAKTRTVTLSTFKNIAKRLFIPLSAVTTAYKYYNTAKKAWSAFRKI